MVESTDYPGRRKVLTGAVAMAAAALAPAGLAAPGSGLQALARAKGLRFGSAVSDRARASFHDPRYAALLADECGLVVPENELKWQAVRPSEDRFEFAAFDHIVAGATARGLAVRGHTLLWQRAKWMPPWLEAHDFGARPAAEAERLVRQHVTTVCTRYRTQLFSYDVVNEAVLPEDGSLTQTALSRAMGGTEALLDLAFHAARDAAPQAQRVYNDYMSWEPGNDAHREGVLRLLAGFRARRVPVDALGLQSHLTVVERPQATAWWKFLDDVTAMGYALLVTELDVNDHHLPADVTPRDAAVAAYARDYLDLVLSYRSLRDVLVWGLCDDTSWLQNFPPLRGDGLPRRPCLYDADFKPKPLRAAVAGAFASAAARP